MQEAPTEPKIKVSLFTERARGHVHMPFYEGMYQNLLRATGGTLEQLQSVITMASDNRIDSIFLCDSVCISSTWLTTCACL